MGQPLLISSHGNKKYVTNQPSLQFNYKVHDDHQIGARLIPGARKRNAGAGARALRRAVGDTMKHICAQHYRHTPPPTYFTVIVPISFLCVPCLLCPLGQASCAMRMRRLTKKINCDTKRV